MSLGTLTNEPLLVAGAAAGAALGRRMVGWFQATSKAGRVEGVRGAVRVCAVLGVVVMATTSGAARADSIESTSGFDVAVTGRIVSDCRLSGGGTIDLGELTGNETVAADFGLTCNVPFDLSFESARGGLAHVTKPRGEGPFAGTLGYTLNVAVPTRSPQDGMMSAAYSSADLVARKTLTSGEAVAAGGGRLQIRTQRPQGAGLLAGEYVETLSVTLQPRV